MRVVFFMDPDGADKEVWTELSVPSASRVPSSSDAMVDEADVSESACAAKDAAEDEDGDDSMMARKESDGAGGEVANEGEEDEEEGEEEREDEEGDDERDAGVLEDEDDEEAPSRPGSAPCAPRVTTPSAPVPVPAPRVVATSDSEEETEEDSKAGDELAEGMTPKAVAMGDARRLRATADLASESDDESDSSQSSMVGEEELNGFPRKRRRPAGAEMAPKRRRVIAASLVAHNAKPPR